MESWCIAFISRFYVDRVFGSDCSTREVYEQGAKDVAISVARGMNCKYIVSCSFSFRIVLFLQNLFRLTLMSFSTATIFAYGQTSSGKTYTMTGITEYAIADIYEYIQKVSLNANASLWTATLGYCICLLIIITE